MGRFLTRDTWAGNYNRPSSLNRWNYTEGNPVNYTDPSGNMPYPPFDYDTCSYLSADNISIIEEHAGSYLSKNNWLDTYTAAGIAVQCWATVLPDEGDYDGRGPSQVTNAQTYTGWKQEIPNPDGGKPRGYGLLCYIIRVHVPQAGINMPCTVCEDEAYMKQHYGVGNYQREDPHNQYEWKWAVEYMRRTIKLVLDVCEERNCLTTDKYIAAALSQNGPGFNIVNMKNILRLEEKDRRDKDYKLDWKTFFGNDTSDFRVNTQIQLTRFEWAIEALMYKGWTRPAIDTGYIQELMRGEFE